MDLMNPYFFLPLLAFILNTSLVILVLLRDRRSFVHRIFSLFLISMALWGVTIFGMRASPDLEHALLWERAAIVMISSISVFFYHFSLAFTNTKPRRGFLLAAYLFLLFVISVAPTSLALTGMQIKPYGYAPIPGPLFFFPGLLGVYFFIILGLVNLTKAQRVAISYKLRNQYLYIIIGLAFSLVGGIFDILPVFGLPSYPGAIIGNTVFAILATVAILKHHLLDIHIVIRKSIAYFLISAVIAIPYVGIIFLFSSVFKTRAISPWFYFLLLIGLAIGLQPLWSRIQSLVDRWFYREKYSHFRALEQFSQETKDITNLEYVANSLIRLVSEAMQTASLCLMLPNPQGKQFVVVSSEGLPNKPRLAFQSISILIHRLSHYEEFLERKQLDIIPELQAITLKERDIIAQLRAELLIPLKTTKGLIGILILGPKLSEKTYSEDDLRLLKVVSQQVATTLDNARLYEELKGTYEDLRNAQERLIQSEKISALGVMTSGIAHDFNNMLTTIIGRAQLALDEIKDGKARYSLELIKQAGLDAAGMVRRLQDFARVRADHASDVIDLNEVFKNALEMIKPRLDEQWETLGSSIEVFFNPGKVGPIEGSATELKESLVNILINAIDAMPHGGKLTVKSKQDGDFAVVSISDTGVGMTTEVKRRAFDPFFTTKGSQGLGMGLSVVYGAIKRHKGQVSISSKPQKGCTFTIRIPVTQKGKEDKAVEFIQSGLKNATILVVDDDEGPRDVLYEILTRAGHRVDIATSGKEGLSLARQKDYDLVLADLGMRDISGQDVATYIKIDNHKTQVILVTGWGIQLDPTKLRERGVDSVVAKPFSKEGILALVNQLLNRKGSAT